MPLRRHLVALSVIVVAIGVMAAVVVATRQQPSSDTVAPQVSASATLHDGAKVPLAFDLYTLAGTSRESLAAVVDHRPAVINFWASWCPLCAKELASFATVDDAVSHQVQFVGIDTYDHDPGAARSLIAGAKATYPVLEDTAGTEVANAFGIGEGLPDTFFVNAKGRIVREVIGAMSASQLRAAVRQLTASS